MEKRNGKSYNESRNTYNGNKEHSIEREYLNYYVKSILESMHDGIYITDKEGYTIYVNKAYETISGLKRDMLIGRPMEELIKLGYFADSASLKVLREKKTVSILDDFKTGTKCLVTSNPVFDENGDIVLVVTNLRNMTELYSLENKLDTIEALNDKYIFELKELRKQNMENDILKSDSKKMNLLYAMIDRIAETEVTILVLGETGVGKEVISKEIHKKSMRKDEPFIKINCASIPETLFESELFGYEKGAFTGAANSGKPGLFELANKGTILLDEIGEICLSCQTKLLRVLQEKQMFRIGGKTPIELDVRIIAATNQNLKKLVDEGKFREDLYYRLNIVPLTVPPLRERKEDIVLFALSFLDKFNSEYDQNKSISYKSYELLINYEWPGNIRQLKNTIQRLVLTCPQEVINVNHVNSILKDLNIYLVDADISGDNITLKDAIDELEKKLVYNALKNHGSTRKAALALGVSQPTIVRKAKKYGI